ncbi:ATP-binding Cassette (ABC) Superfamily [Pseudoloma neurophilia]|uniref:ATP-binding Cassette (ABC) Superfamily n=1 Tax=Pseudoloma neurophilia TaxID=146866 RepID=A0A0R0LXL4_9MICR|nr:ATP-binding Cassette (ABC) Superfamily [Pseudoloma neurophilia]
MNVHFRKFLHFFFGDFPILEGVFHLKLESSCALMEFSWQGIDIEVPNNNKRYRQSRIRLVSDANGSATKGMLAVMGPSGSGKTTLMNAFVGRIPSGSKTTGRILLNGSERSDANEWLSSIGYVDQDDTIFEDLTALETVEFAAKFRLKDRTLDITQKTETLFKKLNLMHVMKNKMKSLSGGERKRVMIAVELVTDPKIIFLDEPTSGLDNNTGLKMINILKELSQEGRVIVFTIHQPDDLTTESFDNILLLSQGRSVYMGPFNECESYLKEGGFVKGEKETFSNFAMRVLDVEPGVYYESVENSTLDKLVQDVKKKYQSESFIKNPRTTNEGFTNFSVNLEHAFLVYKRKFKLRFFVLRNLLTHFGALLIQGAVVYIIKATTKENFTVDDLNNPTNFFIVFTKSLLEKFLNIDVSQLNQNQICDTVNNLKNAIIRFSFTLFLFAFPVAAISLSSVFSFYPELTQIKREIGVNTYSTTSYLLGTVLYELTNSLFTLIVNFLIFLFVLDAEFNIIDYVPFLILFFISMCNFLLVGSICSGPKLSNALGMVMLVFSAFPLSMIIQLLKAGGSIDVDSKWPILLNLFPSFPASVLTHHFAQRRLFVSISNEIKKYDPSFKNLNDQPEIIDDLLQSTGAEFLLIVFNPKTLRKSMTGFDMSPYFAIIPIILGILTLLTISTYILGKRLSPSLRMRLNSQ